MIIINNYQFTPDFFPDGSQKLTLPPVQLREEVALTWRYENDAELFTLIALTKKIQEDSHVERVNLWLPYVPNARFDRVKNENEVFTLKVFADIINSLNYARVYVVDAHSDVSLALIDRVVNISPRNHVRETVDKIRAEFGGDVVLFFPDAGAMKRYSDLHYLSDSRVLHGVKERDWETGEILDYTIPNVEEIEGKNVVIVDDICSRGGTFYHASKKIRQHSPKSVSLFVSHLENTVLEGELIKSDLLNHIYTTESIWTGSHDLIETL